MATGPSRDLAHQLSRAERLLTARMSAILSREGCTLEEWRVLKILADSRGHLVDEIAEFAMVPVPTVSELVDRMASDGLAYLRDDDQGRNGDRHGGGQRDLVYLSLHGRDLYEGAAEVLSAAEAELTTALGGPGELPALLDRLTRILSVPTQPQRPQGSQSQPQRQRQQGS